MALLFENQVEELPPEQLERSPVPELHLIIGILHSAGRGIHRAGGTAARSAHGGYEPVEPGIKDHVTNASLSQLLVYFFKRVVANHQSLPFDRVPRRIRYVAAV